MSNFAKRLTFFSAFLIVVTSWLLYDPTSYKDVMAGFGIFSAAYIAGKWSRERWPS